MSWATCNLGCCPRPPARNDEERRNRTAVPAPIRLAEAVTYLREVELDFFSEPYLYGGEVYVPVPEFNPTYWDDDDVPVADIHPTWGYKIEWRVPYMRVFRRRRVYHGISDDPWRRYMDHGRLDNEVGAAIRAGITDFTITGRFDTRKEALADEYDRCEAEPVRRLATRSWQFPYWRFYREATNYRKGI